MTTTPNPLAALFGGAQQQSVPLQPGAGPVAVPGGLPAPDPNAAAQQALGPSKEQMALLTQALQQAATPRFGGGQQPAVPGQQQPMSPTPPGYMQQRPWGPERFMYQLQSSISQLSAAQHERDVRKAENMYSNVLTASQKYMKPDPSNPSGYSLDANAAAQDPFLSTLKRSDYKKMADTLQESWLNPKTTNADKEALNQAKAKFDTQQQQRGRLDKFVQGLIHKATAPLRGGPQLTPEQQQAQTTLGRAPLGPAGGTVQDALAMSKSQLEIAQAQKALQEKYTPVINYRDGSAWMVNLADPRDKIELKDTDNQPFEGKPAAKQGEAALVNGMFYGVWWNGRVVPPSDPEAQNIPNYAQIMQGTNDSYFEKRLLGLPPQILGQVGAPPNPNAVKDDGTPLYPGGRSNKDYGAKLKAWSAEAQQLEINAAIQPGIARAKWFTENRYVAVANPDDPGNFIYTTVSRAAQDGLMAPNSATPQTIRKIDIMMTSGPGGAQLTAFRTALQHAQLLGKAMDALNNGDITASNAIRNQFKTAFGSADVTNFNVIAKAFVGEMTSVINKGHITDADLAATGAEFKSTEGPAQLRGAIDGMIALSTSKVDELYKQYEAGTQAKPQPAFPPGTAERVAGEQAPAPPRPADPGMKWQYNSKTKQFRQVPVSGQ